MGEVPNFCVLSNGDVIVNEGRRVKVEVGSWKLEVGRFQDRLLFIEVINALSIFSISKVLLFKTTILDI